MRRIGGIFRQFLVVVALWPSVFVAAASSEPTGQWKTGPAFRQALARRVDVVWSGKPLRGALERLSQYQGVAVLLDRRIDPDRKVEFVARDMPLDQILQQLASQSDATLSYIGAVVYVGPRAGTSNLSRVAASRRDDARQLPRSLAARVRAQRRWHWDKLATPRDLIDQLARQAGVRVEGIEQVPHDLWPEMDLPSLPWTDRMSLVLTGFDLTFEFFDGGKGVRLVPLPRQDLTVHTYPIALSPLDPVALAETFPAAQIDMATRRVTLHGTEEEHELLARLLRPRVSSKPKGQSPKKTSYTLKVTNQPVGAIIKTLEQRMGLQFEISPDVGQRLYHRVTFDVREVTLNQLLDKTLTPAGLEFRRQLDTIMIRVPNGE